MCKSVCMFVDGGMQSTGVDFHPDSIQVVISSISSLVTKLLGTLYNKT